MANHLENTLKYIGVAAISAIITYFAFKPSESKYPEFSKKTGNMQLYGTDMTEFGLDFFKNQIKNNAIMVEYGFQKNVINNGQYVDVLTFGSSNKTDSIYDVRMISFIDRGRDGIVDEIETDTTTTPYPEGLVFFPDYKTGTVKLSDNDSVSLRYSQRFISKQYQDLVKRIEKE